MTGHKFFSGDNNDILMAVQKECYPELSGALFETARDRYLLAVKLIGIDLVMAEVVRSMKRRDYKPLEGAYDIIAAHYRYSKPDANQLLLFSSETIYKDEPLADKWMRYYYAEVYRLIGIDEELCRMALIAGMSKEWSGGKDAATAVMDRLAWIYTIVDWAYPAVQAMYYIN